MITRLANQLSVEQLRLDALVVLEKISRGAIHPCLSTNLMGGPVRCVDWWPHPSKSPGGPVSGPHPEIALGNAPLSLDVDSGLVTLSAILVDRSSAIIVNVEAVAKIINGLSPLIRKMKQDETI